MINKAMTILRLLKEPENGDTLRLQTNRNLDVDPDIWTPQCSVFSDPHSSVRSANSSYFQREDQVMSHILNTALLGGMLYPPTVRVFHCQIPEICISCLYRVCLL